MKILRQNEGEKAKPAKYVRSDLKPIQGAVDIVKWYIVEETERPPSSQFETIEETFELTDDPNAEHPYFFKAIQVFTVTQIPNEAILQRMNDSLGRHLDDNYPLWKRQKHLYEVVKGSKDSRVDYIQNLKDWEDRCRASRDQKESDLINNNQMPTFDWEPVPQN